MSENRKKMALLGMKLLTPFHKAYQVLNKALDDEEPQLALTSVLSFFTVIGLLMGFWPIQGLFSWIVVIFLCCMGTGICAIIVEYGYHFIVGALTIFFYIPASFYQKCKKALEQEESSSSMGAGKRAEVGIKYFIEKDKTRPICHAKYLGPQ